MNNQKLENILVGFIKWISYFTLLTPLIVSQKFFYAFIVPKTIYFRILVNILLGFYLILILNFPKYRLKFNGLTISVTLFLLVLIISSVAGVNFQKSFWSVYERETGLLTFFHLYAFFIILSSVLKKEKEWEKIFIISIIIAVACSLFAVASTNNVASTKGGGTIGNTSFLGTYLLFNIFFALSLLNKYKFSAVGIFAFLSLFIMTPVLFTSEARAAALAALGGFFLVIIGHLFLSEKKSFKVLAIIIPLVLMASLVTSYFYVPRVQNFINGHLESMKARYLVWEAAWKGFLEKPLLGWGPENYNIVFVEHFDPRLFLREFGGEVWFDRSHNIILDTLVTTGIFGLISYLSIFFVSVFYLFRKIKKQENPKFNLVIIALLAAYLFQNMTVFDIISSYMTFFLTLAYIAYLGDKEGNRKEIEGCSNPLMKKIAYSAVFVLIGGLIYFGNIQPARGSTNTLIAIVGRRLEDRVNAYEETLTIPRYNTETNRYFASQLINNSLEKEVDKELIEKGATLAERSIREDIEESPSDYRSYLSLSRVYIAKYRVTQDKKELDLAEKILNEAIQLSPQNQNAYWLLSDVKIQQGNIEESIKAIRKTIDLEPRFYRAHWYLVSSYMMQENYEAAYNAIQEAEEYGIDWTKNLEDASKILTIYERVSGREEAISFAQKLLEKYPNNAELWLGMAIYSYNAGNFEEAKEAAEKAVQLNPGIETSNKELIETLLNGNLTN